MQSEFKKQQDELRKQEKEANSLVLAYGILPNDSSYAFGKKSNLIKVSVPKRLLEQALEDGRKKYGTNFVEIKKEVIETNQGESNENK